MLSTSIKHLININILYLIFNEDKLYYYYKNRINLFKFSQIYNILCVKLAICSNRLINCILKCSW